jgi:hypothetical protein
MIVPRSRSPPGHYPISNINIGPRPLKSLNVFHIIFIILYSYNCLTVSSINCRTDSAVNKTFFPRPRPRPFRQDQDQDQDFYLKTKTKTFFQVLEAPRDQDRPRDYSTAPYNTYRLLPNAPLSMIIAK